MESFGAYLKAHREKKGIRLEEIASITKIHLHALELLEGNKWELLPPEPFVRGFILAYAKYVGMNTADVLARFRETTEPPDPDPAQPIGSKSSPVINTPNEIIARFRLPSAPRVITAFSLIAVVGLAAILINVGRKSEPEDKIAQATPSHMPEPAQVPVTLPAAVPGEDRKMASPETAKAVASAAVSAADAKHEVTIEGKERTWLKVVVDENQPAESFLAEGKSTTYRAEKKIKVVLGNATGSRVLYNGNEVEGKQFMGAIRTYKFPPDARFPQDVPSTKRPASSEGGVGSGPNQTDG